MKMLTNEGWKEDFPNKKWLEDHGFKLLKDCEDVVDWAANQAEREYLDTTYRKELSKGVYIRVWEDKDECWNAVLFSDTYNYSTLNLNAKNAVNEVRGKKGDREKTFTIKAEIDSSRFELLENGAKGNWGFLPTYAEFLSREVKSVDEAWKRMKSGVETWLKTSYKDGSMKKSSLNHDYEIKKPKILLQKEFIMDIPSEIDEVFENVKRKFGSSYDVVLK